jgi:hypothetical protein
MKLVLRSFDENSENYSTFAIDLTTFEVEVIEYVRLSKIHNNEVAN